MPGSGARLSELNEVSPAIAWKLVDTLFTQVRITLIGASMFMLMGLICFVQTGSRWYLGAIAYSGMICALRLLQARDYACDRDAVSQVTWARRFLPGAWLLAAGWGAWSVVIPLEPDKTLVVMVIGAQSAWIMGAATRNSGVRLVANGQVCLTLLPLCVACLLSGSFALRLYAGFVLLHWHGALTLIGFLHQQTLQLLMRDQQTSGLVASLEIANQELEVINQHLETLVATDALTQIANRRAFDLCAAREWHRAAREQAFMALLLIDIDHFKAFNDFYGHPAGDTCLQEVAATISGVMGRPADLVARYGGEEFAVVLPETDLRGAIEVAERVLSAVQDRGLTHDASVAGYVTVSVGAASLLPDRMATVERLIGLADAALYTAKRTGRNRVTASDGTVQDVPIPVD